MGVATRRLPQSDIRLEREMQAQGMRGGNANARSKSPGSSDCFRPARGHMAKKREKARRLAFFGDKTNPID